MKRWTLSLLIGFALVMQPPVMRAGNLYVYAGTNGVAATAPRPLPSLGVDLTTRKPVLGLHGATDQERAACGWYRVIPWGGKVATNEVITGRAYKVDLKGGIAQEEVTIVTLEPRVRLTLRQRLDRMLDSLDVKLTEEERVMEVLRTLADAEEARIAK